MPSRVSWSAPDVKVASGVVQPGCATIVYSQSHFHGNRTVLREGKYHKFQEHVDTVGKLSVGSLKVLRVQDTRPVVIHPGHTCGTATKSLGQVSLVNCGLLALSDEDCNANPTFMWNANAWRKKDCTCCGKAAGGTKSPGWDVYGISQLHINVN